MVPEVIKQGVLDNLASILSLSPCLFSIHISNHLLKMYGFPSIFKNKTKHLGK